MANIGLFLQRLMVLDAIVEDPDLVWLGTAEEKSTHLTTLLRIEPAEARSAKADAARLQPQALP